MKTRFQNTARLLLTAVAILLTASATAQEEQDSVDVPEPESPAVLAILETNPDAPDEWARAASILAGLDRPALAKGFLQRLIRAKPSAAQLVELAEQFDVSMFTDMAQREELLPEARILSDAVLGAVNRKLQDPKRIAALIGQLAEATDDARTEALVGLREAGGAAITPLVAVLADADRADEHPAIRQALVHLGSLAIDPLLSLLEGAEPELAAQAILVLGQMKARRSAIFLLRPYVAETSDAKVRAAAGATLTALVGRVPTREEAVRILVSRAREYFDKGRPVAGAIEGKVEVWYFDRKQGQPTSLEVDAEEAARILAARLARDAHALAGDDPQVRLLYLTTMLEEASYAAGLDQPLPEDDPTAAAVAAQSVDQVEEVLEHAVATEHLGAAAAAARILGRQAADEALLHRGAQPAPLVLAARHGDRRLRAAALDAIVRLQPVQPFPGSSYVVRSLAFAAGSGGTPRALVAGPVTEASRQVGGMLAGMGYQVDTAATGRELFRLATASPDYELALIDVGTASAAPELLLQQLRNDYRSADLRVGLIARSGYLERAQKIAARDPLAMAFSRPRDGETLKWQLGQLDTSARRFVDQTERRRQAVEALSVAAELSVSSTELYDLRPLVEPLLTALYAPRLSADASAVLGNLDVPQSQRALVELASLFTQPVDARKAAAGAFGRNVERNGLLLKTDEIRRQYERYNQSQDLDAESQQILAVILDFIEAPTQAVKAAPQPKE